MAQYFSILLVILTAATGLVWLVDAILFAPKRKAKLAEVSGTSAGTGTQVNISGAKEPAQLPWLVDTSQQIFPILAFVLVLRSFLYEPFQIPSGSMMPTLLVGDFILVEKFTYGLRDPVARKKFVDIGAPERGDVVVFKFPTQPNLDYIKRVVGLPGDTVVYRDKQVYIKPACHDSKDCAPLQPVDVKFEQKSTSLGQRFTPLEKYTEQLGGVQHAIYRDPAIYNDPRAYKPIQPGTARDEWIVPEGHYFVLGDNRDNSLDSRFWGFVPEANLVGKAVAIWISFEFDRVPSSWVPGWIPTGVRFNRVGGIQ